MSSIRLLVVVLADELVHGGSPSSASISATFFVALARPSPSKAITRGSGGRTRRGSCGRSRWASSWDTFDAQHVLDLLHELKRVAGFAVELVHEGEDGDVAQVQTLKSFLVWASTPLAASMTMTAASAAIRVR